MRRTKIALALAALPLTLGGCAALGVGQNPSGGTAGGAATGDSWVMVDAGKRTPSPAPKVGKSPAPSADPSLTAPAPDPSCTKLWPRTEPVLIPLDVTVGRGSVKVEWPTQYGSDYRVTAVPQELVTGAQPEPVWKKVAAGAGCTVTTTITGLTAGKPYIVWLDAPNTGYEVDGTRHLYSGRSRVVYPG